MNVEPLKTKMERALYKEMKMMRERCALISSSNVRTMTEKAIALTESEGEVAISVIVIKNHTSLRKVSWNMRKRRGQIVNRKKSNGLGVHEFWVHLFELNEKQSSTGAEPLTDQELTQAMLVAFPDRAESQIFYQVNRVRQRYNRGLLTHGVTPVQPSQRYVVSAGSSSNATSQRKKKSQKTHEAEVEKSGEGKLSQQSADIISSLKKETNDSSERIKS